MDNLKMINYFLCLSKQALRFLLDLLFTPHEALYFSPFRSHIGSRAADFDQWLWRQYSKSQATATGSRGSYR